MTNPKPLIMRSSKHKSSLLYAACTPTLFLALLLTFCFPALLPPSSGTSFFFQLLSNIFVLALEKVYLPYDNPSLSNQISSFFKV